MLGCTHALPTTPEEATAPPSYSMSSTWVNVCLVHCPLSSLLYYSLSLSPLASIVVAPPSNVFVRGGETIMIVCAGIGSSPELFWSRGGDTITNATDDRVTIYEEFGMEGNTPYIQSILEICSTQESDEGVYECTVTSRTVSNTVNFTLSVNSTPATIVIAPADTYPIFNSSVFLTCVAAGYPLPTITWYREGERVDDPDNIESEVIEEGGEQFVQSTLLVCSVQETARYNCSVSNGISGGATTSVTARVVVEGVSLWCGIFTRVCMFYIMIGMHAVIVII